VSLSPEDAAEAEQILAVFDEYMTVYVELAKTGASGDRDEALARLDKTPVAGLAEVSPHHDVLESNHEDGVVARRRAGLVRPAGERELEVPASFDPVNVTPLATIRVCVDETNWSRVDVETGDVVSGPGGRYLPTVAAVWVDAETSEGDEEEPGWYVNSREDGLGPC